MPVTETIAGRPILPGTIAVVRSDNVGDAVLFSGVLEPLRRLYPAAHITLYVKDAVKNLLELCPHVDEVASWDELLWPLRSRFPHFPGRDRLDGWLGRRPVSPWRRPDMVIMPQRSPSPLTHRGVARLRGDWTIGTEGDLNNQSAADSIRWASLYDEPCPPLERFRADGGTAPEEPITELEWNAHFLEHLSGAKVETPEISPVLWLEPGDHAWASHALLRAQGTSLLVLAPGVTSTPGKFYSGENLKEAVEGVRDVRFSIHIMGSPGERVINATVAEALEGAENVDLVQDHTGKTTLRELAAALSHADLVLAQETGALHLATALDVPSVGIVGGGHYGRFYPWGNPRRHRVANQFMECYQCNWVCRFDTLRCIQEIPPARIAREMVLALGLAPAKPAPNTSGKSQ